MKRQHDSKEYYNSSLNMNCNLLCHCKFQILYDFKQATQTADKLLILFSSMGVTVNAQITPLYIGVVIVTIKKHCKSTDLLGLPLNTGTGAGCSSTGMSPCLSADVLYSCLYEDGEV